MDNLIEISNTMITELNKDSKIQELDNALYRKFEVDT